MCLVDALDCSFWGYAGVGSSLHGSGVVALPSYPSTFLACCGGCLHRLSVNARLDDKESNFTVSGCTNRLCRIGVGLLDAKGSSIAKIGF